VALKIPNLYIELEKFMNFRTSIACLSLLATFGFSPATFAVEALDSAELESHCKYFAAQPESPDGIFCVRYVQGFIDGAVATDERVTYNVVEEYEQKESYSERAMRTRIGNRMERYGASVYAEFCLGDPVPLREVVEKVAADLEDEKNLTANPLARNLVYQTLRENYPCEVID
jgi:hypothetical protein